MVPLGGKEPVVSDCRSPQLFVEHYLNKSGSDGVRESMEMTAPSTSGKESDISPLEALRRVLAATLLGALVSCPLCAAGSLEGSAASAADLLCAESASQPADPSSTGTTVTHTGWRSITAQDHRIEALLEARLALGEGDRLIREDRLEQARERWLAAAEAFRRAREPLGAAEAYQNLANSYLFLSPEIDMETVAKELGLDDPSAGIDYEKLSKILSFINVEAILNPKIFNQVLDYYFAALFAGAEVYEPLIQQEIDYDREVLTRAEELYRQGYQHYEAGDCGAAIALLDEARQLYRKIEYGAGQARALAVKMRCQMQSSDAFGAMASMQEAMQIVASLPLGEQTTQSYLAAKELYEQGKLVDAEVAYLELTERYRETEDLSGLARVTLDLGAVYSTMERFAEGEQMLRSALDLFGRVDEEDEYRSFNIAAARSNLGHLSVASGRPRQAMAHHCTALRLWRELGNPANEVASLSGLGLALRELGSYRDALAVTEEAWALQQRLSPEPEIEGDLLNNIGYVHFSQGKPGPALDFYRRALERRRLLPHGRKVIETLINIASVHSDQGRFEEALTGYREALELARRQEQPTRLAKIYGNIAGVRIQQGKYQEAIRTYLEALPTAVRNHDRPWQGLFHLNLSSAYQRVGDSPSALDHLRQALVIFEEIGNPDRIADVRGNLGALYLRLGEADAAEEHLREASRILLDRESPATASLVLGNLALTAAARGDLPTAITEAQRALALSRKTGKQADQARLMVSMAALHLRLGDFETAHAHSQRSVELAVELGMATEEVAGRVVLAAAHRFQGQRRKARRELGAAIDRLESLQGAITVPEFKSGFLDQFFVVYDLAVLLSADAGHSEDAFRYAEQARARAFLDQISNRRVALRHSASAEMIEQEQDQRRQLRELQHSVASELEKSPGARDRQRLSDLRSRQEAARTDYAGLLTRLKVANPEYASLVSAEVLGLREVQKQILDDNTTLVEYFVMGASANEALGGGAWAWVIDRESYRWVHLDVGEDLRSQVDFLRHSIAIKELDTATAAALYDKLVAPLRPHIRHHKVILVPHGVLHYLPFAALWNRQEGRFLVQDENFVFTLAPSANVLRFLAQKRSPNQGRALVLGNPDGSLTHAGAEAEAIASFQGTEPLLGPEATESAVRARAPGVDLLHLAAHGLYNPVSPLFSHVELAPGGDHDGHLQVHEIYDLDLTQTDLVVVSACESALGDHSRGDELIGLTRAFLYAGSPAVVTSLWPVDDAATAELMGYFYRHLGQGAAAAEALRQAQLQVMAKDGWGSPYYWAAFTLTGDSGSAIH